MSALIYGYFCSICDNVQESEICRKHPDKLLRLILDNAHTPSKKTDKSNWCLFDKDNRLVCTMPGSSWKDADSATRIGLTLTACSEISNDALSFAYIQTLQQLADLVSNHLQEPTKTSTQAIAKQLALIELCSHSDS